MPRTLKVGLKEQSTFKGASLLSTAKCSKRGILLSIVFSIFLYFTIVQWYPSIHRAEDKELKKDIDLFHQHIQKENGEHSISKVLDQVTTKRRLMDQTRKDFEDRKRLYEEKCTNRTAGTVIELFFYPPSKLVVCHVPKAGCTFWKRLFRYLYTDHTQYNISSLYDIDRIQAHFGNPRTLRTYDYQTVVGHLMANAGTKVLMVRSPYRRLWSAYLDKFVLPEWWLDHGKAIMFGRNGLRQMKYCPDDITFEEFLGYTLQNHERHWQPISQLCDPCTFNPTFVGHTDTFMRYVRYILTGKGLESVLGNHKDNDHLSDDIQNLVDYHYQLYQQRPRLQECLTRLQLASILWRVLQLKGYFKLDHSFPKEKIGMAMNEVNAKLARDNVIEIFLQEFEGSLVTDDSWGLQRDAVVMEAYRNVSDATKEKIMRRYYADFDLFGFNKTFPG